MRLRLILPTLAAAVFALAACGSNGSASSAPDTISVAPDTAEPTPTPSLTADDMTQLVVNITWDEQTEDDKDAMCLGIALQGPEWAAEQMRAGAGDESVDWDRAAELVEAKCANR